MFTILASALIVAAAPPPLDAVPQTRLDPDVRCLLGAYALAPNRFLTITGAGGETRDLEYTLSNGQFGKLEERANGVYAAKTFTVHFEPCSTGKLTLEQGNIVEKGVNLGLIQKETSFTSDGVNLHGKLVLPRNGRAKLAAVWIEGSGNSPSTDDTVWQFELARRGIATFVYDKRGTGASDGALNSDFHVRARDTAAAVGEVRRLAPKIQRVGVIGGSQGGWIAPLTATKTRLDFVISAFGMAEGPIAQDRALIELQLRQAGFGEDALAESRQLTTITERIVRSNMREGFSELETFKARYAEAAWIKAVQPRSYTGLFLAFPTEVIKLNGPSMAQGLTFDYEPRPIVEAITPRQLWLLAGSDQQAPNKGTQTILRQLQRKRRDISVVIFPKADHGMVEEVQTAAGTVTAYSERLFDVTADWIKEKAFPEKGRFIVMPTSN
ncbi:MAG: alpha/beta fold hydrolase [Sphingomonadales bacterium]|nr:alpha/beta fold hydrolase [Sphingomonadales bacterium]